MNAICRLRKILAMFLVLPILTIQPPDIKVASMHYYEPATQHRIVFDRDDGNSEIYSMYPDGSNQVNLTKGVTPSWSPDGTKIVFSCLTGICMMNADGSDVTEILSNGGLYPSWSPDGLQIAYSRYDGYNYDIWVTNIDGTNQVQLTDNPSEDIMPSWSPDGKKIVFQSDRNGNTEVYVMDANGANPTNLTNNSAPDGHPDWSPDGTKIAFESSRMGYLANIFVMNADGSEPVQLTKAANHNTEPAWSPDGTSIAFTSYRDSNAELYVMDAEGSCQYRLTNNAPPGNTLPVDRNPDWRPVASDPPIGPNSVFTPLLMNKTRVTQFFKDDFSNSDSGWPLGDDGIVLYEYLNGEYRFLLRENYIWAGATPGILETNFSAEVDVRSAASPSGTFGILFGLNENWSQLFSLEISNFDNEYIIWHYDDFSGWDVIGSGYSTNIKGYPDSNRIRIDRMGTQMVIFINGKYEARIYESSNMVPGQIGLIVSSYENNVDTRFDNFLMHPICANLDMMATK